MRKLEGRVAVVTGGSRGIGAATARLFAAEGAKVVIADLLTQEGEALATEIGDAARYVHLDVNSEVGWRETVELAEREFKALVIWSGGENFSAGADLQSMLPAFMAVGVAAIEDAHLVAGIQHHVAAIAVAERAG